ncbi:uncharacterized protein LOC143223948 [Tachypleus tridentatus]|uniref:uncharacterized protein LOC143223948 n=1 Tax=Tachypleus tridentatus TaxID=6853 RepID=UPI003FD656B5
MNTRAVVAGLFLIVTFYTTESKQDVFESDYIGDEKDAKYNEKEDYSGYDGIKIKHGLSKRQTGSRGDIDYELAPSFPRSFRNVGDRRSRLLRRDGYSSLFGIGGGVGRYFNPYTGSGLRNRVNRRLGNRIGLDCHLTTGFRTYFRNSADRRYGLLSRGGYSSLFGIGGGVGRYFNPYTGSGLRNRVNRRLGNRIGLDCHLTTGFRTYFRNSADRRYGLSSRGGYSSLFGYGGGVGRYFNPYTGSELRNRFNRRLGNRGGLDYQLATGYRGDVGNGAGRGSELSPGKSSRFGIHDGQGFVPGAPDGLGVDAGLRSRLVGSGGLSGSDRTGFGLRSGAGLASGLESGAGLDGQLRSGYS